jgi:Zn-dependent protease
MKKILMTALTSPTKQVRIKRNIPSELTIRTPWFPIVFKPGAIALFVLMTVCSWILIADQQQKITGELSLMRPEAILAGMLSIVGLLIHELGHAVTALLTGRRVERIQIGLAGGAVTSGDSTPLRRAISIIAGPAAEIVFGVTLFSLGGGHWGTVLGAVGFVSLVNGFGNLLPFHKTTDGYRLLMFLRLVARGNAPLRCMEIGPCPACSAKFA